MAGVQRRCFEDHVLYRRVDDSLIARTAEIYLSQTDPTRTLLLRGEADALRRRMPEIFERIARSDCRALLEHEELISRRHSESVADVERLLESVTPQDPKAAQPGEVDHRPADPQAREQIHRRRILEELSWHVAGGADLEKARTLVVRHYRRIVRQAQRRGEVQTYARFIDSFARALDPSSMYLSSEVIEDFLIAMRLDLAGIGLALSSVEGHTVVVGLVRGGSAERHGGIREGDRLVSVAEPGEEPVDLYGMDLREVVKLLRGPADTSIDLTVRRPGTGDPPVTLRLSRLKGGTEDRRASLHFAELERDGRIIRMAIIGLTHFEALGLPEALLSEGGLRDRLREARDRDVEGIVLNLSDNGGGRLDNIVNAVGLFLPERQISMIREPGDKMTVLTSADRPPEFTRPLVVLSSHRMASGAELAAAALQDYRRAVVVGDERTPGFGMTQQMVRLPRELGALKLSTGLLFRPSGAPIEGLGVRSDIVVPWKLGELELGGAAAQRPPPPEWRPALPMARPQGLRSEAAGTPRVSRVDVSLLAELGRRSRQRLASVAASETDPATAIKWRQREALEVLADWVSLAPTEDDVR